MKMHVHLSGIFSACKVSDVENDIHFHGCMGEWDEIKLYFGRGLG